MAVQISIIGLGQIGMSIGLALAGKEGILRVGHDYRPSNGRDAQKAGAIDRIAQSLRSAVQDADLVLLTLPLDQMQETLRLIAPDLKENAVVIDTAPLKAPVLEWASQSLPPGRHHVSTIPVINPAYLEGDVAENEAAHADYFTNGLMAIVTASGTDSAAIKLAVDLASLLGASPLFTDVTEVDSLMAAIHVLPQLAAAAILEATLNQPGWLEARKLAGKAYAQNTSPADSPEWPAALSQHALLNRENTLRVLDHLVETLQSLRQDIAEGEEAELISLLTEARDGRARWWKERLAADWAGEQIPGVEKSSTGSTLGQLFFGRWGRKDRRD